MAGRAANLAACFQATMAWEGGGVLSLARSDPGNWTGNRVGAGTLRGTKWGVAAGSHPGLDIANVTKEQAREIFAREYWAPVAADALPAGLDHCVVDHAYNSGARNAVHLMAKGGIAPASEPLSAIKAFSRLRLSFLRGLRTWRAFGPGWARRVGGVEAESLRMAMAAANLGPADQDAAIQAHAISVRSGTRKQASAAAASVAGAPTVHVAAQAPHAALDALAALLVVFAAVLAFSAILNNARADGLAARK